MSVFKVDPGFSTRMLNAFAVVSLVSLAFGCAEAARREPMTGAMVDAGQRVDAHLVDATTDAADARLSQDASSLDASVVDSGMSQVDVGVPTDGSSPDASSIDATVVDASLLDGASPDGSVVLGRIRSLASGIYHSCAVDTDGQVACWGESSYEQLSLPDGVRFEKLGSGATGHHCGIVAGDRNILCWGTMDNFPEPTGSGYESIAENELQICALRSRSLRCWNSQFATAEHTTFPGADYTQIDAGGFHFCGVTEQEEVVCWGQNFFGQATPPAGYYQKVSAGGMHSCALDLDGKIVCWGGNDRGQLNGIPDGEFIDIDAGFLHTCALDAHRRLTCWGDISGMTPRYDIGSFSSVGYHTCVTDVAGERIECWGFCDGGQCMPPA